MSYFPGFAVGDDFRQHRLTYPDQVSNASVAGLRSWLGTLAAAATPEHPAVLRQRDERRARLQRAVESDDTGELREWAQLLEEDNARLGQDVEDYKQQAAALGKKLSRTETELGQIQESFAEVQRAVERRASPANGAELADSWPATVAEAIDAVEELARCAYHRRGVILTSAAVRAGRDFDSYASPAEIVRACQAVIDAGTRYHDNTLGVPPGEFFRLRGYGYAAQPSPHLNVDESTSPDQCLRIYWDDDPDARTWTITSIGPHA